MTEDAAVRLGRLIRERRRALKLTQADVQAAGGPSTATLRLIENGKHTDFRPSTSQPLETALQWQAGSITAVLDGGEPTPIPHVSATFSSSGGLTATAEAPGTGVVAEVPKSQQKLERAVALSFLADEVDAAASLSSPDPDADPDDIEAYISEVDQLVSAADELTDAVHKTVLDAFGGDLASLRQMKRDVRRANLAKHDQVQPSGLDEIPPPPRGIHGARRMIPEWARWTTGGEVLAHLDFDTDLSHDLIAQLKALPPKEFDSLIGLMKDDHRFDDLRLRIEGIGYTPKSKGDDAELDLPTAARTAPPGYTPGQPEQGEADGEENQDSGSSK